MKRFGFLLFILVVLLAGGGITANLLSSDLTIEQTTSPDASVFMATPDQATLMLILVGFIIVNVLGAGITIMLIFWLLNRQVVSVRSSGEEVAAEAS